MPGRTVVAGTELAQVETELPLVVTARSGARPLTSFEPIGSTVTSLAASRVPERNSLDEIWPSPGPEAHHEPAVIGPAEHPLADDDRADAIELRTPTPRRPERQPDAGPDRAPDLGHAHRDR